ncbi:MAG: tetratricopeptide repeat protein [Gemmatimonadetes bacterium]|nr:tetratricopeptide repeat protein [Gemmatimonadota bacterium]
MRSRRLVPLALVLAILGGCATKRDLRDLQTEMQSNQNAQRALLQEMRAEIRRQNAMLMDSLSTKDVRLRGDLANRLVQIERQLVQIQELTGQGQQGLTQLRQELRAAEEAARSAAAAAAAATPTSAATAAAGDPAELFTDARAALDRGSFATARAGFEEFVRAFPQHARAAEAQLLIGESREKAKESQPALEAYQRVVELHPNSTQAPTALFRAAMLEVAAGNRSRARTMLTQLTTAYPRSPEVTRARTELAKLR